MKKTKKKKETKREGTRRLETERELRGLQKMKSDLWKQRRDKDQKIRDSWMQVRRTAEIEAVVTETSLEEEAGYEEWWKEELTLTEEAQRIRRLAQIIQPQCHLESIQPAGRLQP